MILDDDHRAVQDAVRGYVQDRDRAERRALGPRRRTSPRRSCSGLAALGCYGVAVPTEYDGAGLDYLALAVILEEIAAGDGATSTIVSVNNCPVCSILMAWASDAQKEQWLKPLARGEMLGAFCLTEPHVGSEAERPEDDAPSATATDYVLNGVKQFITSGKNGDVAIVMAVTDKARGQEGHQRLRRADGDARLHRRPRRGKARPARQRHGADPVRELPRPGGATCSARKARA